MGCCDSKVDDPQTAAEKALANEQAAVAASATAEAAKPGARLQVDAVLLEVRDGLRAVQPPQAACGPISFRDHVNKRNPGVR